ncbi:molybdopterin molybdotransferase MoeA [Gellertiella hungarica]|uniref:Molybdopterin molybdenumtransferase n=1 Tax=Gellertiella hungarica TaxID=1572859 RepID=A0A7W6NL09_9HYPH|nr:gephyrin-like molybdotransferase Glp [Gellertiella hungarica]MBB4064852.1 molybdopterin molybdotransferase [Gellertiella hungarica]
MTLLSVATALSRLLEKASPLPGQEDVPLDAAVGRVLAADVAARLTQPPFDSSAMDGYALRAADIATVGAELSVIGESAAGHGFAGSVGPGETVRIFTGAPVPDGADTVMLQEDAEVLEGGRIRSTFVTPQGRHIRPKGQDFMLDEVVLEAGRAVDFATLLVAAGMNHATLPVWRKPIVAIIATGDELALPGSAPGPNQIIASSTYAVAALARQSGAEVIDLGIVPDSTEAIGAAVADARSRKADVLITLGGASVGDHDLVQSVLTGAGMQLDFWKIAMRPGKPLMVGSLDEMHVLGLPGNPVSSMVCALLFMEPLIRKLAHLPPARREATAITVAALPANDHRQDFVRARLYRETSGKLSVESFGKQDSSLMKQFSQADCLIVRPPHAPELPAGMPCPVLLLHPESL